MNKQRRGQLQVDPAVENRLIREINQLELI